MSELLRPYGVVIDGVLELGLELVVSGGVIHEVRPHTGIPDDFVISPAFVNAHSHLEYRGLQGKLDAREYWPWIGQIRIAKLEQDPDAIFAEAELAAKENVDAGVALIGEHSDRPVSGRALKAAGLTGVIFQELITRSNPEQAETKADAARLSATRQSEEAGVPAYLIPHAYQTVDDDSLRKIGLSGEPFSMHVAESDFENQFTLSFEGPIADTYRSYGIAYQPSGKRLVPTLDDLGLVRSKAQFVHCCAINSSEVELLATRGVTVAHCPRSNVRLSCPAAPVREMLDAGMSVGIGLDSPASGGPIDMIAEMRSALDVSTARGKPLTAQEIWNMATGMGADSLRFAMPDLPGWRIEVGANVPLIRLDIADAMTTYDLIAGDPQISPVA